MARADVSVGAWALRRLRGLTLEDFAFAVVVGGLTLASAALPWIPKCLVLQDYPQCLVFSRVVLDHANPASPFHGTYAFAPWFTPTSLVVHLTAYLALVLPGGLESAGKLLLSAVSVGLVGSSALILRELRAERWGIVLVFPLLCNGWTFFGFFAYATALPCIFLGIALTLRWFAQRTAPRGLLLAATLVATLLWHGIAYAALGLAFAVLWLVARFRRPVDWIVAALPTLPSLALFALWQASTFGKKPPEATDFVPFWQAVEGFGAAIPAGEDPAGHGWLFVLLVLLTQLAPGQTLGCRPRAPFRVHNPLVVVGAAFLAAYLFLPIDVLGVAGLSNRFALLAATCLVYVWRLPRSAPLRFAIVVGVIGFGLSVTDAMRQSMAALDRRTRGASTLIDRLDRYDTLYYSPRDRGSFPGLAHALIELEQIATLRKGGLPNSSFAGYGNNYVRYANGHNPMPGLYGPPAPSEALKAFDYVLVSDDQPLASAAGFRLVGTSEAWSLYGVCGSRRFPRCD